MNATNPTTDRPPVNRGVVAGTVLVATILLCAAVGFGLGALVGAEVILGLLGLFVGLGLGMALVYRRFRDI